MEIKDGMLIVRGWVWLLLIAAALLVVAVRVVKRHGGLRKILFGWDLGDESFGWTMLFFLMVALFISIVGGTTSHLLSS